MSLQIYVNFSGIGSSVKKSLEGIIRKKTNTVCTLMSTNWLICTVNYIFLLFSLSILCHYVKKSWKWTVLVNFDIFIFNKAKIKIDRIDKKYNYCFLDPLFCYCIPIKLRWLFIKKKITLSILNQLLTHISSCFLNELLFIQLCMGFLLSIQNTFTSVHCIL